MVDELLLLLLSDGGQLDWADGRRGGNRCGLQHGIAEHLLLVHQHALLLHGWALGVHGCLATLHKIHHLLATLGGRGHPAVPVKGHTDRTDHAHVEPQLARTQHVAMVDI